MSADQKGFTLYKIYSDNFLIYLGRTKQPLKRRLHAHFFKTAKVREINIESVTKIEYAHFKTEADLNVYEIYYINKLKPILNRDDKAKDELSIKLPDVPFQEYHCHLMDRWREEIRRADTANAEKKERKLQLEMEKKEMRKKIFAQKDLSLEEKQDQWSQWLETVYLVICNDLF